MEYKRLTTDEPQGNTGYMLNMTKVIDKEVYLRNIDGESNIRLVDYCKVIYKEEYGADIDASAEEFGEYMDDDSLLSLFYWMSVGHAELGLRLAAYEDSGLSPVETQELAKEAKAEDRLLVLLPCKRGDRIYNIRQAWDSKEKKHVNKIRCTRFECYSIYPEDPIRIYYKCAASSSWIEIENLYLTREEAKKALETGGDTP